MIGKRFRSLPFIFANDNYTLSPKYRRKVFFNEKKEAIREIIRTLCQWKGVEIIEGEICPDHIHLLLSIPPKMSVSGFMGYLKASEYDPGKFHPL